MKHVAKVTKDIPASANILQWWSQIAGLGAKNGYVNALFNNNGSLRTDDTANWWFFNPN